MDSSPFRIRNRFKPGERAGIVVGPLLHHRSEVEGNMNCKSEISRREMLSAAADQLQSALALLDCAEAPAQIGAHVDLASHQLKAALESYFSTRAVLH
jgi:hypothetical protein